MSNLNKKVKDIVTMCTKNIDDDLIIELKLPEDELN